MLSTLGTADTSTHWRSDAVIETPREFRVPETDIGDTVFDPEGILKVTRNKAGEKVLVRMGGRRSGLQD